jgi:hypothetical protein
MIGMVAFAKTSDSTLKTTPRARGQHRTCTSRPLPCFKSSTQANLRTATHKKRKRLGSCSKDPAGFVDGVNLYAGYFGMDNTDADGLCSTCKPSLQRGGTEPKGLKRGPRHATHKVRGSVDGSIRWEATDGGVTLESDLKLTGTGNGVNRVWVKQQHRHFVDVACQCLDGECLAFANVIGGGLSGASHEFGDVAPDPNDFNSLGASGKKDIVSSGAGLLAVASGNTIHAWGFALNCHTKQDWYVSYGNGVVEKNDIDCVRVALNFTWKCMGACP